MHAADLQELSGQQESLPCTTPLECIQARGNTLPRPKKIAKKNLLNRVTAVIGKADI